MAFIDVFSCICSNNLALDDVKRESAGNSMPPWYRSYENLLSPVTFAQNSVPPFFKKKYVNFERNFGTCPNVNGNGDDSFVSLLDFLVDFPLQLILHCSFYKEL